MTEVLSKSFVIAFLALCLAPLARADEDKSGWRFDGAVSYLSTSGNTETSSTGLALDFKKVYEIWTLELGAGAVQAAKDGETNAESYLLMGRGSRAISERVALTAGLKGEKDRFAGISLRSTADLGFNWKLRTEERWTVDALSSATWTNEDPIAGDSVSNVGFLLGARSELKISENASTTQIIRLEPNLEDSDDYRIDASISVESSLTDIFAVKLGYDLRYDNVPVTGFDKTDTRATASLVVKMRRGSFSK